MVCMKPTRVVMTPLSCRTLLFKRDNAPGFTVCREGPMSRNVYMNAGCDGAIGNRTSFLIVVGC